MNSKYYISAISAFIIWGFFSIPLKALSNYTSIDILISRIVVASILILAISLLFRQKVTFANVKKFQHLPKHRKIRLLIINTISAVLLATNWFLFIYVMNNISVNATSLAYMLCPIITTVLAYFFLHDKLSKIQWFAVIISTLSCLMLSLGHFAETLYSFIIALSYAIYLVLQKYNSQLDRFFTLTFQIVLGTMLLFPLFGLQTEIPVKGVYFYSIIFVIAAVFTILPMFLNVFSLNKLNSSTAGIFIYLNPIISFLLAIFYFHEQMSLTQVIAYALVFISVILFNLKFIHNFFKQKRSVAS